jgi:hypothetical protein
VCGRCPSIFKLSDGETGDYVCLLDEEILFSEKRLCEEEAGKACFYSTLGGSEGNKLSDKGKEYLDLSLRYWNMRKQVIDNELKRRGKLNE